MTWALAGLAVAVALAIPASSPADTPVVSLALSAPDGASRPQGERFNVGLTISNPATAAQDLTIQLGLIGPAGGDPIFFDVTTLSAAQGDTEFESSAVPSQWFAETGDFELIARSSDGAAASLALTVTAAERIVPRFEDVTDELGLGFMHGIGSTCNGAHTAGAAWGDIEGDGDLDLFVPDQNGPARMFVNEGGGFVERASALGVDNGDREGYGATFADFDNDGDPDLFVTNSGPDRLYVNDGAGHFTDRAPELGVADPRPATSASFADFDGDGLLDIYVTRWGGCTIEEYLPDSLYRQQPGGGFVEVNGFIANNTSINGRGFLGGWIDYDLDNDPDLYLANDFTQGSTPQPNALWRNDGAAAGGAWSFSNVTAPSGTGLAMNSMGLGIADYDRDLDPDIAISNMGPNVLLRNNGDGGFTNVAEEAGIARPVQQVIAEPSGPMPVHSITWGLEFADLNNDGFADLYVAAGEMLGMEMNTATAMDMEMGGPQPNEVFVGGSDGTFLDLSEPSGAADPDASRGVAVADYDGDGRLDIYVVNRGEMPHLFRNVTPRQGTHWLEVETVGTESNADGCGARIRVTAAGRTRSGWIHCGGTSLGSSSDHAVHFGLGTATAVDRLRIDWPSGQTQELTNVAVDRRLAVTEPADPAATGPAPADPPGPGPGSGETEVHSCGKVDNENGIRTFPINAVGLSCAAARDVRDRYEKNVDPRDPRTEFGEWTCEALETHQRGRVDCEGAAPKLVNWRWRRVADQAAPAAGYGSEIAWIKLSLRLIAERSLNPPRASRLLAHLSASIGEAIDRAGEAEQGHQPLPRAALLAGSAGPVLKALLPATAAGEIDAAVEAALESTHRVPRAREAYELGETTAATLVRRAELDGGSIPGVSPVADGPEDWVRTPPAMAPPLEPGAGDWDRWNVRNLEAVMPEPPPAYGSAAFDRATTEVYETSLNLTDAQRAIALHWADGAGTATPPGHWNQIAIRLLSRSEYSEAFTARMFEALNTAQADAFIACWAAKYQYFLVRPMTEIRRRFDPAWNTIVPTPPFPSYPSGHSTTSGASATVLSAFFPEDAAKLIAWAREAGLSRVYAGIHYPFDDTAGRRLGVAVAKRALATYAP